MSSRYAIWRNRSCDNRKRVLLHILCYIFYFVIRKSNLLWQYFYRFWVCSSFFGYLVVKYSSWIFIRKALVIVNSQLLIAVCCCSAALHKWWGMGSLSRAEKVEKSSEVARRRLEMIAKFSRDCNCLCYLSNYDTRVI